MTRITRYKQSLHQDWKDEEITQQEYWDIKADYERQAADLADVLARLTAERADLANCVGKAPRAGSLCKVSKHRNADP
ncbi:hypothetical protein AALC16_25030 [Lachnospiraceae bacterium 29-91]